MVGLTVVDVNVDVKAASPYQVSTPVAHVALKVVLLPEQIELGLALALVGAVNTGQFTVTVTVATSQTVGLALSQI